MNNLNKEIIDILHKKGTDLIKIIKLSDLNDEQFESAKNLKLGKILRVWQCPNTVVIMLSETDTPYEWSIDKWEKVQVIVNTYSSPPNTVIH